MFWRKSRDLTIIILFMTALWLPLAAQFWWPEYSSRLGEKRALAVFPEFNLDRKSVEQFPRKFEAYYDDHFGFRAKLIHWHSRLKLALKVSASPRVLIGKQDWLFYRGQKAIEDYRNTDLLSEKRLRYWRATLRGKRDLLAAHEVPYLFVIAPNKHTVYPEFLPRSVNKVGKQSRLDQLLSYMSDTDDPHILDLRPHLLKGKGQGNDIYFKTDTHWNQRGVKIAHHEILAKFDEIDAELKLRNASTVNFKTVKGKGGDLAKMLGLQEELTEYQPRPRWSQPRCAKKTAPGLEKISIVTVLPPIKFQCRQASGRLLMIHDSFGKGLIPQIAENFQSSLFVHANPSLKELGALVEVFDPDVVLELKVQRSIR